MGECGEVSMLSGISRSVPNCWMEFGMSCNGNEKVNEKPLCIEKEIDGNEGEVSGNVDLIDEYPPLCRGWVDRPFDDRVNEEKSENDDRVNEEKSENEASTKAFRHFLVKIPRLDDQILKEQIWLAELHLDDKTSFREAIQLQIQTRIQNNEYEHAVDEVKNARELVKLKRKEIDSHRSVVRVVKNALPFDDMDSQEAFEQQLEYLKTLKKDLDILKASVVRAENAAAAAQRKNHDQEKKVKELEARFRVANDACQAAYAQLTSLRAQHREKMRQFFGYRDEATAASNHAYSRNCEAPDRLCKNQVERFMKMWNKNSMFRQDYVNSNAKSTIRRFGTLDGCSLGPDEKPHMLPQHVYVPVVNTEEKENREENEQGISGKDVSNEVTREAEESERKEAEGEGEGEMEGQKVELLEMGEELKAQTEAEKREKKRHKRLRLKERKKAARLGPIEEPPMLPENSEDHQMEENEHVPENSEQSTSLKENEQVSNEFKEGHDLEENEQVPDNQTSEALKMKEGEDELKEDVQLQGQTEADQREKKRQKRLRKKERKKAEERKKAAREGRSAVDQRVDLETPELQNRNPEMPSDADHVENQQVVNEETPEPYVSNPEMQRDADEKRDQNQQPYTTLTHPKEEENKEDPKEEENKEDPKEEENKQEEEEEEEENKQQEEEENKQQEEEVNKQEEEEENKQQEEEEVNKQDPKEEVNKQEEEENKQDLENKQDAKEEENKEEEVTMQVVEQPRVALMEQMRAEIKAQLEAETRDKKRAKKLRRKERNKEAKEAAATHGRNKKTFIWVVIFILMITLILFLTHFDFNFTSILWS